MPPEPPPKPPSSSAATHRTPTADDAIEAECKGTRTPSIREIEQEYSSVEERSKRPGTRLSRLTGTLANWMHLK